jgi:hypothetical protein
MYNGYQPKYRPPMSQMVSTWEADRKRFQPQNVLDIAQHRYVLTREDIRSALWVRGSGTQQPGNVFSWVSLPLAEAASALTGWTFCWASWRHTGRQAEF